MKSFSLQSGMLAPSILSADFMNLEQQIQLVEGAGADIVHLDIMDGHFVPNLTFGPPVIKKIRKITKLPLDVHLMITNAEESIDNYIQTGVDMISVHVEAVTHLQRLIKLIKSNDIKAGVVLNPSTSLDSLDFVLEDVDFVLLMSVNPGFGGQSYIPQLDRKITELKAKLTAMNLEKVKIQVDGGVSTENIKYLKSLGVDIFVAGSAIFGAKNIPATINTMKKAIK